MSEDLQKIIISGQPVIQEKPDSYYARQVDSAYGRLSQSTAFLLEEPTGTWKFTEAAKPRVNYGYKPFTYAQAPTQEMRVLSEKTPGVARKPAVEYMPAMPAPDIYASDEKLRQSALKALERKLDSDFAKMKDKKMDVAHPASKESQQYRATLAALLGTGLERAKAGSYTSRIAQNSSGPSGSRVK